MMSSSLSHVLMLGALLAAELQALAPQGPGALSAATPVVPTELLARQPIPFVPNLGQWQHPANFVACIGATTAYLEPDGFRLTFLAAGCEPQPLPRRAKGRTLPLRTARGAALHLQFVGAGAGVVTAEQSLSARHNYFLGDDASRWRTAVPTYAAARYRGLYPGVEVRCYTLHGHFEYDLELAPGADLAAVRIAVAGAERLAIDGDGALVFETAVGPVRQPAPVTFTVAADGRRQPVAARYRLCGEHQFGFEVPEWRGQQALVVDPGLVYSTTLAGVFAQDMVVGADGAITVLGDTIALGYPTTPGAIITTAPGGGGDWFVTQLDPSLPTAQQNRYTTYFGGSGGDSGTALAIDANGRLAVAGILDGGNYPTTPGAFASSYGGGSIDAFVTLLDPSLPGAQQLLLSTLLGGGNDELPYDISIGPTGDVLMSGFSDSPSYPVTANAFDGTVSTPGGSAIVSVVDPGQTGAQQLKYSSFLGGTAGDDARSAVLDLLGRITVVGYAESTNFPTTPGAFQTVHASPIQADAYVAQLDPSLPPAQQLVWSTLFGGNADDWFDAVVVDPLGSVISVAGTTGSNNLPVTPGAFQSNGPSPSFGSFLARFLPQQVGAAQLDYASHLHGNGYDFTMDMAVAPNGAITVVGGTDSTNFPTTPGCYDPNTPSGATKSFVTRIDPARPAGSQLVYSTLVGGGTSDYPVAIGVDPFDPDVVTIAGYLGSPSYPVTPGAFGTPISGSDLFVTQLDLRPTGVQAYGSSSPGCNGPLAIGVMSWPQVGASGFSFTCSNAPSVSIGALVLNYTGLVTPTPVLGIDLWVDPIGAALGVVISDASGAAELPLPIPSQPTLAGLQLRAQYAFLGVPAPLPCPALGWSASNALVITIQP